MSTQFRIGLLMAAVLVIAAGPARAERFTWDGGGADDNIASAKNWESNTTPPNDGTSEWIFVGAVRPKPITTKTWSIFRIIYPNFSANEFSLKGSLLKVGTGGVLNGSLKAQSVSNDILLVDSPPFSSNTIFSSDPGDLNLYGDIDLQSYTVEVYGSGQTRLYGNVTGSGGRIEVGSLSILSTPGTLVLTGTINVDVDTRIGTLVIDTDQPQPPFTTLAFDGGTRFRALGIQNISNAFLLNGNVIYDGSGQLRSSQTITGSGSLTVAASTGGVLGLGPANNFNPFSGQVSVIAGTLELNGGGTIAQLDGTLLVGNGSGGSQTAVLRSTNAGVLAPGLPLTIAKDGFVDIAGPISFSSLVLTGGDLTVDAAVTAEPIQAGGSSRMATMNAPWAMPLTGLDYDLSVTNGSANPDILLLAGCEGPGTLRISGGGQVELRGDPTLGPAAINVMAGELVLNRPLGASVLLTAGGSNATIRTINNEQFSSTCEINLLSGCTLDVGQFQQYVGRTTITNANVTGLGGFLRVYDDLNIVGTVDIEPALSLVPIFAPINVATGAVLTTGTVDGTNMRLVGGGFMSSEEINGNFAVNAGTLRFSGFADGDLDISDTLEIPADSGAIAVNGTLTCGPTSTLNIELDSSGAVAGDEFSLIQCLVLTGSFASVQFPVAPVGHFWTLVYSATELKIRLDAIGQTELHMDAGTNGQNYIFGEAVRGVIGIDFTLQGSGDRELCSVTVDSLANTISGSDVGVRLYRSSDSLLLASADEFLPQSPTPSGRVYALNVLLQPGIAYRLVFYSAGDASVASYEPGLPFPYLQSTLMQINGAYEMPNQGDVFPTAPLPRLPHMRMLLGPCQPTSVLPDVQTPRDLALNAWPNPFNPSTTLQFDLPREGRVAVDVFDTRGRRVASLVNEHKPAGRFEVQWRGTDDQGRTLGSGVYFLRLSHPAGEKVRRVTLLK